MANAEELSMLGQRLANLRVQHNYSQKELSIKLRLKPSIISSYENGARFPSLSIIIRYAQLFHVSTDYILGVSDNNSVVLDTSCLSQKQATLLAELIDTMKHE
jgi:transcriptional regulator with XRE-family HTH domain